MRSKLDQTQILQTAFDEESGALKTAIVPVEISLEGSSRVVVQADGAVDATGYEYVCLYGTGVVEISPDRKFDAAYPSVSIGTQQMLGDIADKSEARAYLAATDWYIVREMDSGTPCPQEIKDLRAAARLKIISS